MQASPSMCRVSTPELGPMQSGPMSTRPYSPQLLFQLGIIGALKELCISIGLSKNTNLHAERKLNQPWPL